MKVRLVSHASVLIESGDCVVWTDPWLSGKVFNDSWSLFPSAAWDDSLLGKIDYIWISHEHPDHFNIPTLRSLPDWFKRKTTILFQDLGSAKMVRAFTELGFHNVRLLGHRRIERLTQGTRAYCYYIGLMDSCLAVTDGTHTVLDVNDAQLTTRDCRRIVADVGRIEAVLNQFSIAFYSGLLDYQQPLRRMANGILDRMYRDHLALNARVTIPFASLMYFSSTENKYINEFYNTPASVFDRLGKAGVSVVVLYPGDTYELGRMHDSTNALKGYEKIYAARSALPYDQPSKVEFDQIARAFFAMVEHLDEKYPPSLLRALRPVTVRITDLGITAVFSVPERSLRIAAEQIEPDMLVGSQSLHFAFSKPYGFQTLGISGRLVIPAESRNLRLHRLLFSLDNAELYLRPRFLIRRGIMSFLRQRSSGGANLLFYVIRRMRHISPLEGFQG
ncbi:MAG: MBL fold metallo-hydrolase [Candidatus Binataceae bacterium]